MARRGLLSELSAEVLQSGKRLRFRARGGSMYPFIKDGEVIEIEPCPASEINVGEVVFYRSSRGNVIAHRVTGRRSEGDRLVLLAKGDSAPTFDEPVYADQVLGRVTVIERGQKKLFLNKGLPRVVGVVWSRLSPYSRIIYPVGGRVRRLAVSVLKPSVLALQSTTAYRRLGRRSMAEKVSYRLAVPGEAEQVAAFFGQSDDSSLREWCVKASKDEEESVFYPVAVRKGTIIGALAMTHFTNKKNGLPGWWLWGVLVRGPYRGLGIGEALVRNALKVAEERGATEVNLFVFEKARAARRLYEKIGFREIEAKELEEIQQGRSDNGERSITMTRRLVT